MNEADTRYHLVDPALRDEGYQSRDRVTLETVLTPPPVELVAECRRHWRIDAGADVDLVPDP